MDPDSIRPTVQFTMSCKEMMAATYALAKLLDEKAEMAMAVAKVGAEKQEEQLDTVFVEGLNILGDMLDEMTGVVEGPEGYETQEPLVDTSSVDGEKEVSV